MSRIITIGEIMLRLQPPNFQRFLQANSFEASFGGGEANVAVSLAQFGEGVAFVSKLPQNDIGTACVRELKGFGVDTTFIAMGGTRMGIYFCEKGASQRPSKVIYDRANSAFAELGENDFDITAILQDAQWLHFTGITPALGENVAGFLEELLKKAKQYGVRISCDLNYRGKLWSKEKACEVMTRLMQYVDVLISNEEDCKDVFNLEGENSDVSRGVVNVNGYKSIAKKIQQNFGIDTVAFTLRESISASINNWSGLLCTRDGVFASPKYTINIVDRVGGGDSFGAGLIYGLINNMSHQDAINFAVASSAIKHTIEGDFNIASVEEVEKLARGNASGRVER